MILGSTLVNANNSLVFAEFDGRQRSDRCEIASSWRSKKSSLTIARFEKTPMVMAISAGCQVQQKRGTVPQQSGFHSSQTFFLPGGYREYHNTVVRQETGGATTTLTVQRSPCCSSGT
jgi:hypothetical protein